MSDALASRLARDFQPGDVLFREGEAGEHLFLIQSGRVRLSKQIDGREQALGEFADGELVGDVAIINAASRHATATVTEPTRCLVLDGSQLELMVTENAELAVRVIKSLATRLAATRARCALHRQAGRKLAGADRKRNPHPQKAAGDRR
jgi:CRP-like cAMP-binding protein